MGALIGLDWGTGTTSAVTFPRELPAADEAWGQPNVETKTLQSDLVRADGQNWRLAADGESRDGRLTVLHGLKRLLASSPGDPQAEAYVQAQGLTASHAAGQLIVEGHPLDEAAMILFRDLQWRVVGRQAAPELIGLAFPGYPASEQLTAIGETFQSASPAPLILCSEGQAAAAVYSFRGIFEANRRVTFVNVGAGQSWAAIVYFAAPGAYEILAERGDLWLGGDDLDACLSHLLHEKLDEAGILAQLDPEQVRPVEARLLAAAEAAKRELGKSAEVEVLLPFLYSGADRRPQHVRLTLHQAEVQAAIGSWLARLKDLCRAVLADSGLQHYDVEHLVLLGGQTQSPLIRSALSEPAPGGGVFGRSPHPVEPPTPAPLAFGAALIAARTAGRPGVPYRLSEATCGSQFPAVLRSLPTDLWLCAAQLLTDRPDWRIWSSELQGKAVQAAARTSIDDVLVALRERGEAGLDELIQHGRLRKPLWGLWPFS